MLVSSDTHEQAILDIAEALSARMDWLLSTKQGNSTEAIDNAHQALARPLQKLSNRSAALRCRRFSKDRKVDFSGDSPIRDLATVRFKDVSQHEQPQSTPDTLISRPNTLESL